MSRFILYANHTDRMIVVYMSFSAILLEFRNSHDCNCILSTSPKFTEFVSP